MTSLPLTPAQGYYRDGVPDWGTDKPSEKIPLWTPKPPTWHQRYVLAANHQKAHQWSHHILF